MEQALAVGKCIAAYLGLICLGYWSGNLILRSGLAAGILLAMVSCALAMIATSVSHFDCFKTRGRASWLVSLLPVVVMVITFLWGRWDHDARVTQTVVVLGLCLVPAIIARFVTLTMMECPIRDDVH